MSGREGINIGCTHPLIRYETFKTYRKQDGGRAFEAKMYGLKSHMRLTKEIQHLNQQMKNGQIRKWDMIPCGHCIECYRDYARDKAVQLSLENLNPEYADNEKWFITLTYNDDLVPIHTNVNIETGEMLQAQSLRIEDLQNFWKRVRQYVARPIKKGGLGRPDLKIRYLVAGEYGATTYRPHYHAIVFGLPLDETKLKKIGNNKNGDILWTHPKLQELWSIYDRKTKTYYPIGNVQIGRITFQSISYVARYTLKKANKNYEPWWYIAQGKNLEFICQSDDLGLWYYEKYKDKIYSQDLVPIQDSKGNFQKPPRSFDRRYKAEFPKKFAKVLKKRKQALNTSILLEEQQTNMLYDEILESEELKAKQFKDLRGDL